MELCEAALDGTLDAMHAEWDPRAALGVVLAADGYPDERAQGRCHRRARCGGQTTRARCFTPARAPRAASVLTAGGRVLCAVGLGDNVSAAQAQAYALVDAIRWHGMQCRRDIGYRAIAREKAQR